MKKIAVLSSNEECLRFLTAEVERAGFSAVCSGRRSSDMIDCIGWIVDADSDVEFPQKPFNTLLLSSRFAPIPDALDGFNCVRLSWPVSLRELTLFLSRCSDWHNVCVGQDEDFQGNKSMRLWDGAVEYRGDKILLTEKEFALLRTLWLAKGEPVSKHTLALAANVKEASEVCVYLCRLRKKLEKNFSVRMFETVRNYGYRLCFLNLELATR